MNDDLKNKFPQKVHGVLEHDGGNSEDPYFVSYEDEPYISESPRLVATYKLVGIRTLKRVSRVVTVRQRKRRKKA